MKKKLILLTSAIFLFSFGFITIAKASNNRIVNDLKIGNVHTEKISTKNVTIKWDTNKIAFSKLYIGTATPVNTSGAPVYSSASSTTSFSAVLQNLATSTKYYYKILASTDNTYASSTTASKEGNFRTQTKFLDLNCASASVVTRDDAIISAQITFYTATKIALEARREALKIAWLIENSAERRTEIKKAWDTYKLSAKNARLALNIAKKTAWNNFKKNRTDCKANSNDDPGTEGFDGNL